nr:rifin PIR protein,putative [Plasmodium sp. DRC-Itaito]
MKLHVLKILLLFYIPLNILLTSYHVNTHKKVYITTHHTTRYTSRVLSEKDIQSSNYNNDTDMKSVMQQFVDRTSQRFEEYKERMKDKRQKYKQQRDKNIEKIIEKDKMDKSLTEKIEKGCLRCGCGLGGVAASVAIFGTVAVKELTKAAITAAEITAKEAVMAEGAATIKAAGATKGAAKVIELIKLKFGVSTLDGKELGLVVNASNYTDVSLISGSIYKQYENSQCLPLFSSPVAGTDKPICTLVWQNSAGRVNGGSANTLIKKTAETIVSEAQNTAKVAEEKAIEEAIEASTLAAESTYAGCQTAIIASVVAIIIIALVMIIIYLVLRYRRKKKMNKKAQYTTLLNE